MILKPLFGVAFSWLLQSSDSDIKLSTRRGPGPPPPGYCDVTVCEIINAWSLSPSKLLGRAMMQRCPTGFLAKAESVKGKDITDKSNWYPGSFNITKASVTRVKTVKTCTPEAPTAVTKK